MADKKNWFQLLAYVTGSINQELLLRNEYLAAENHILKSQIKGRLRLSDGERATLAGIAKRLGRKALQEIACIAKPDTILAWYRKFVAQKFDGSKKRGLAGRPRVDAAIEEMVVKLARENSSWGYDRIVGALANLGHEISDQSVGNILRRHGIAPASKRKQSTSWSDFIRSHMDVLAGTDFFTVEVLTWRGLATYYVLFFIHIGNQCLSRLILFGESSLRKAVTTFAEHYHGERNHQGKENVLLFPAAEQRVGCRDGKVRCKERLGGLLKYYHREAA